MSSSVAGAGAGGGETLASGQSTPTSSPLSEVSTAMVLISKVYLDVLPQSATSGNSDIHTEWYRAHALAPDGDSTAGGYLHEVSNVTGRLGSGHWTIIS